MFNALLPLAASEPEIFGLFYWWHPIALIALIALIIFWLKYRKRQM